MPTYDVVLHTSEGSFRSSEAQQEWVNSRPVTDRVVITPGLWIGQITGSGSL